MRYKPDQKEQTAQKMRQVASACFKSHGYAGIGVNGIAAAAEVTSGAFYAHFGSKENAFHAALEFGLDEVITNIPEFQQQNGFGWVEAFVEYYLGKPHQANLAGGCAMTTLSPEVVRASTETQHIFETKMQAVVLQITDGLDGENKIDRAWTMLSLLIGGLTFVRAIENIELAQNVTKPIGLAAISAAGKTKLIDGNN